MTTPESDPGGAPDEEGPLAETASVRVRQRQATRAAIAQAAFAVIRRDGAGGLTAESVAAEAGVSRRTIFNHFASLDEALQPMARVWFDAFVARLQQRPGDEPLVDSLTALALQPMPPETAELLVALTVARDQSPQARNVICGILDSWVEWFGEALRARAPQASEIEVALAAQLIPALAQSVTRVWLTGLDGGPLTEEALVRHRELTHEAVRIVRSGFGAESDLPPGPPAAPSPEDV